MTRRRLLHVLAAALLALATAGLAGAATAPAPPPAPTAPTYDEHGRLIDTPFAPAVPTQRLTSASATAIFLRVPKVADWLHRYPKKSLITQATYEATYHDWTVMAWSGPAGEIATGRVDDLTGVVTEAWTGPQVAWSMARGVSGAFGGKEINDPVVWLVFCSLFLLGLADLRRPLAVRNLDLLVLLSFSVSLWFFNHGRIFWSVPLVYPPFLYLLGRMAWIAKRGRSPSVSRPVWPVWVMAAAIVFTAGFRVGLNVQDSNVIDVGYSGVIGAQRIASGQSPYGHFPTEKASQKACAGADRDGRTQYRIQPNGRCEAGDENGDTYGPVAYEAYLPGYWAMGWKGIGDRLDAARFTSVMWDLLAILGLALVGLRFGGARLAVTLAFAWAAYPFTQYVSSANSNDAIQPTLLIWGFWLVTSPVGRGFFGALASWTKFAPLLVMPLWATYPQATRRSLTRYAVGFGAATLLAFFVLFLEPNPLHAARTFFDRSVRWQIGRDSPFSIWDWRQYHAGLPDLHLVQVALSVVLVVASLVLGVFPRRKSPIQLAALTAALLIGFEALLTHWFYLYLPWFFPFVAIALLSGGPRRPARTPAPPRPDELASPEPAAVG